MSTCKLNIIFLSFFLVLFSRIQLAGEFYITQPPKGWECIDDPTQLPQKVKVLFIGTGTIKSPFNPSINVTTEETSLSIGEYVCLAKQYHETQSSTRCIALGTVKTESGQAELLQIDRPTQWGDVRFIQAMLIQEGRAYVVTATCLKKEFGALSSQLFKSIQSFKVPAHFQ
jgi:hypothetical protein